MVSYLGIVGDATAVTHSLTARLVSLGRLPRGTAEAIGLVPPKQSLPLGAKTHTGTTQVCIGKDKHKTPTTLQIHQTVSTYSSHQGSLWAMQEEEGLPQIDEASSTLLLYGTLLQLSYNTVREAVRSMT